MSRNENVSNSIWSDPDFNRLSPPAKLVYLWSFTNPRCGMAGVYKVPVEFAALETGLGVNTVETAFNELAVARFCHYVDGVLWVRSRVKHIHSRTTQIARSIAKDLDQIGADHPLVGAFMDLYAHQTWLHVEVRRISQSAADNGEPPEPPEPQEPPEVPTSESVPRSVPKDQRGC